MPNHKAWSRFHNECVDCETTKRGHAAKGRCITCYSNHANWGDDYEPVKGQPGGRRKSAPPVAQTAHEARAVTGAKEREMPEGKWHPVYRTCAECGRTTRPHHSGGVCVDCYMDKHGLRAQRETDIFTSGDKRLDDLTDSTISAELAAEVADIAARAQTRRETVAALNSVRGFPTAAPNAIDRWTPDQPWPVPNKTESGTAAAPTPTRDDGWAAIDPADFQGEDTPHAPAVSTQLHDWSPPTLPAQEHPGGPGLLPPLPDECYPPDATPLEPLVCGAQSTLFADLRCDLPYGHTGPHTGISSAGQKAMWDIPLCGEPCLTDPDATALACANPAGHDGPHSWATPPAFADAAAVEFESPRWEPIVTMHPPSPEAIDSFVSAIEKTADRARLTTYPTAMLLDELLARFARIEGELVAAHDRLAAGADDRRDAERFREIAALVREP